MRKFFIYILLLVSLIPSTIYAEDGVSSVAQKWFTNYSKKISAKNTNKKEILYFEGLANNLNELLIRKKLNNSQINLVNDLIKLSNEHIFNIKLEQNENIAKYSLSNHDFLNGFKYFSYNPEDIFFENGDWYTYSYDKHLAFPKGTKITKNDLEYNKISPETSVVFLRSDGNLGFITEYKKVKLISNSIIYGVSDKYNFLKEIKDDKKKLNTETDELFKKLKQETIDLTKGKTKSQRIKLIYDYVLNNVEYPKNFSLDDSRIFSGIDTYKNKLGVCEGYDKMFLYMLNFSNINNVEVIRGYVLDAQDFPKIGHSWVRIGTDYYDVTFDDPIGNTQTKTFKEYSFYSLPKDLFYTNRYEFAELPEYLKNKDIEFRKGIINLKKLLLVPKYKNEGYNLLKSYVFKLNNGIKLDKSLDIEDFKKIMGYYDVGNFSFIKDGKNVNIKSLKYFIIDGVDIDKLLEQYEYNFNGYYLFKWKLDNGSYEYRLAYDVIVN